METKIHELKTERDQQVAAIEVAKARIAKIDTILDAYRLLIEENVLPESDIIKDDGLRVEEPPSTDTEAKVRAAIAQIGSGTFTVSDIASRMDYSRQTVRRALNAIVDQGNIRIVEQGYRRNPTKYEAVKPR